MPATSQQQQKLFGLALSVKRGETPRSEASEDVLNIVDSMTEKEIEDFAGTSHKGLPKKVEEVIREIVRTNLSESIPKMYKTFLAVQKKVRDLESAQKDLLEKWKSEKDDKKKSMLFDKLKQGTKVLQATRKNLNDIEEKFVNNMSYDTSYSESVNEGYGDWIKAKNLTDIINLSKKKKNAVFYVTDDNNSRIGSFYLKNGKFGKATSANPNYDLRNNKTSLRDRSDVIYKYKVDESVNESINEGRVEKEVLQKISKFETLLGYITNDDQYKPLVSKVKREIDKLKKQIEKNESVNEAGVNVWYFYKKANKDKNKFFKMLSDFRKKHSDTEWIKMLNYALEDFNEKPTKYKTIDDKQNILFKNLQTNKKAYESVNEAASRTAMEIGGLTGMNKEFVQKFVDTNELDIEKVFQFVKKGKLKDRMDFVSAVAGKPNNPLQKKMIKMFK